MSRRNVHPWRDDHLGKTLRRGLNETAQADPGPEIWGRIAREIAPPRPSRPGRWLTAWLIGVESRGLGSRLDSAQRPAVLLGAMTLTILFMAGNFLLPMTLVNSPCLGHAGCDWDRLSRAEIEIQPVSVAGAVKEQPGWLFRPPSAPKIDREARLRRLFAGREAFNRSEWLRDLPRPTRGPAVAQFLGQVVLH